jgi:hypothetical protein
MKCTRVEKFLLLYVAGDLAGRRRARAIEKHLAACEQCRLAASDYRASRELFRAATLSPDFDRAFYDEIRDSVLARIKSDRTLAPPAPFGFPRLFNARLAYAASLAVLIIVAALALHSYPRRTPEEGAQRKMIATANHAEPATPATINTAQPTRPRSDDLPTPSSFDERARATANKERRAPKSLLPTTRANTERARNEAQPRLSLAQSMPSRLARNPPMQTAAATARANAGEVAPAFVGAGASDATPEVSRIEMQTSDPNIRIIWLSPAKEETARPLK